MKIAIIADLHLGSTPLKRGDHVRSASHVVAKNAAKLFSKIEGASPDLVVDMGDLIRSQDEDTDIVNYKQALSYFQPFATKVIHMIGNHEVKKLNEEAILKLWKEVKYEEAACGTREVSGIQIVWVSFTNVTIDNGTEAYMPKEQLTWLEERLTSSKPTILFTHYPLEGSDFSGNFLFDKEFNRFGHYNNSNEILEVLAKASNLKAVFSCHSHWIDSKIINNVPFIPCLPSLRILQLQRLLKIFPEYTRL